MSKFLLFAGMGLLTLFSSAQSYTISGYIRDAENGENLIGATILQKGTTNGTVTNTFGFYSLTLPAGEISLQISFVGYQLQEQVITLKENVRLNFDLSAGTTLDAVVVTAEEQIEQSPQMSTIDVPIEQIKALPVLMGEADILKTLQLLPGIQSGSEGSSGIYVRGGGPDQNLILLDGVPVYNVSHLFGFFSVFNPDAINRVNVVKGGFPARYGGRLSSVIDISMKEGNNQKFSGEGSIGLIASKLTLEGPIGKNEKTSFIVSGRRTYIDILTRPIIKASSDGEATGGYYFYDLNGKINHKISDNDRLYLSFYNGYDKGFGKSKYDYNNGTEKVESIEEFGLGWGNTIGAMRWNHVFGPRLFGNLTGTYSKYKFRIFSSYEDKVTSSGDTETSEELIEYFSGVDDFALKMDFDYLPNPIHNFKFGISATHHNFNPGIFGYDTNSEGQEDTVISSQQTRALEFYTYAEDDFSVTTKLRGNIGIHYSAFLVNNQYYHSLQPRLSFRYLVTSDLSLKASYATMNQYIHLLTNGGIGLPTDLWVPATDRIRPQSSWQVALGAAKTFEGYEVSVEGYYKEMSNLIEYEEGASFFNLGTDWQDKVTSGDGTSYGAELLIQKKTGKFSGWIGYTLSWTYRKFEELNFGEKYPYKYDRRHDISVVGIYDFSKRFSLSSTWVYGTGNAITLPKSTYPHNPENSYSWYDEINNYGSRNSFRMAAYHRMDLGLTWTKDKKNGVRSWSLGAYNVYNRKNPFYIADGYDNEGNKHFYQYSLFPVIPYFRYNFKF
ncbi:MAG: carboxypeptidase-like regulatory domain-containing protein [Marinoscillum sp.]